MKNLNLPVVLLVGALAQATLLIPSLPAQEEPRRGERSEDREHREQKERETQEAREERDHEREPVREHEDHEHDHGHVREHAQDRDRDAAREPVGRRNPEEMRERRAAIQREIAELREQGRHEDAERLARRARETRPPGPMMRREGPPNEGGPGEAHRRYHHLMAAIENLRAGGFGDAAERLEEHAERLRSELGRVGSPRPGGPFGPGPRMEIVREERRVIREGEEDLRGELRELHNHMNELRGQLEEMRRAMREMRGER